MSLEYKIKQGKAQRVLPRECLVIAKPSSNNTRDDSTHEHHQMVNTESRLIVFLLPKMEKLCKSVKIRSGADYGSNYQPLIAKYRLILKKVGNTTRLLRYD